MKDQFVPYELALQMKELGFDEEECFNYYHIRGRLMDVEIGDTGEFSCWAPLWQQAFDWFREKYGLYISIRRVIGNEGSPSETISWTITGSPWDRINTYKEARIECLKKLIELCKKN